MTEKVRSDTWKRRAASTSVDTDRAAAHTRDRFDGETPMLVKRLTSAFLACALVLVAIRPLHAHHSFAAEFDVDKRVTLDGVVTKVEWTNPHTYFYVDVTDASGKVTTWAVEGGAPNALYRAGWKPTSLKAGDRVIIVGSQAKDGSNLANAISFTLSDGRCLFAGSSGPGGEATGNCTPARR